MGTLLNPDYNTKIHRQITPTKKQKNEQKQQKPKLAKSLQDSEFKTLSGKLFLLHFP